MRQDPLLALAAAHGILANWHDLDGHLHVTGPDTALALLRAMGAIGDAAEAPDRLAALEAERATRRLPRRLIVEAGCPSRHAVRAADTWRLEAEDGSETGGHLDSMLDLPGLAPGLHHLILGGERCLVIAAPPRAPSVEALTGRGRLWGMTGAVHALWRRTTGHRGRASDLGAAMASLAPLGAAFLGINPVHALGIAYDGASPYSPSHRGFYDIHLIDDGDAAEIGPDPRSLIDYAPERASIFPRLLAGYQSAMAGPPGAPDGPAALAAYRDGHGRSLEDFARFEALSLKHGPDWRHWPAELRHPDAPAVHAFAEAQADAVALHVWAQMNADQALARAQEQAHAAGMSLGLYADLAVGVRPGGAETWARQGTGGGVFARGVSLGAPPDMFSTDGQAWGLAPFSPPGLAADGYAAFAETLRATMCHAGMVRIDHILGLERTWWVPDDGTPGGYVTSDAKALFAILRLEAAGHGCLVIGEDLGVVPDDLRPRMAESGLYGCSVAMFEHWEGTLRAPWHYRDATLASFGTHDTPTLAGWWEGRDIRWRAEIGHLDPAAAATLREARARDRATLLALLAEAWILPDGLDPAAPPETMTPALSAAIHRLLARASSAMVAVQIDDALGTLEQANIPGTTHEHPNWRRRHGAPADALGTRAEFRDIARIMAEEGRA